MTYLLKPANTCWSFEHGNWTSIIDRAFYYYYKFILCQIVLKEIWGIWSISSLDLKEAWAFTKWFFFNSSPVEIPSMTSTINRYAKISPEKQNNMIYWLKCVYVILLVVSSLLLFDSVILRLFDCYGLYYTFLWLWCIKNHEDRNTYWEIRIEKACFSCNLGALYLCTLNSL